MTAPDTSSLRHPPKRVLILGASGMIGRAIQGQLGAESTLQAVPASHRDLPGCVRIPFAELTTPEAWAALLRQHDIHAVVNCVGIWQGSAETFERIQYQVPVALFEAGEHAGVQVVQLSALGFSTDSPLPYAATKARADRYLLEHCPSGTVLYPSLVFGSTGPSSQFFLALAALPIQVDWSLPANLQPVHVHDVARCVVEVLTGKRQERAIELAGAHPVTIPGYFSALRRGMGLQSAPLTLKVPRWCGKALFELGEALGAHFVNRQAWTLLQDGTVGSRNHPEARPYDTFADPSDLEAARENQLYWFARLGMAFLWLWTAGVTWIGWPRAEVLSWLGALGPGLGTSGWLATSCALDAVMGVLSLIAPSRRLWKLQAAITGVYSLGLAWALPWSITHPFGLLTKNLAVLATLGFLALHETKRNR